MASPASGAGAAPVVTAPGMSPSTAPLWAPGRITVASPSVVYSPNAITSTYTYNTTSVSLSPDGSAVASPSSTTLEFTTLASVPRTGVLVVGLGGNNGTTLAASLIAHRDRITWATKKGRQAPTWYGSLTQCATVRLGSCGGRDVHAPLSSLLPMLAPGDIVLGGWDISALPMDAAMARAQVLDGDLQRQVAPAMAALGTPLRSFLYPTFVAANQDARADNLVPGDDKGAHLAGVRADIAAFKAAHNLDSVVVLWSANTERFSSVLPGVNDTADALLASIAASHTEVSPSTVFAVASILEGCTYINGSPSNTFVPGVMELAAAKGVHIAGDDFKSGQTKMKSVLVDFLISAGIKPTSVVSYNHLGNNDGFNLVSGARGGGAR